MTKVKNILIPFFLFIVFDTIWLGYVTKDIYISELASIARLKDGNVDVVYWAAVLVYLFLAVGISFFVLDHKKFESTPLNVFLRGGLFGLLTYGLYDMTNVATLKDFTVKIAFIDMAWGSFACATVSLLTYLILRRQLKA